MRQISRNAPRGWSRGLSRPLPGIKFGHPVSVCVSGDAVKGEALLGIELVSFFYFFLQRNR